MPPSNPRKPMQPHNGDDSSESPRLPCDEHARQIQEIYSLLKELAGLTHSVNRLLKALEGDEAMGIDGLALRIKTAEDDIKSLKKFQLWVIGGGMTLWTVVQLASMLVPIFKSSGG